MGHEVLTEETALETNLLTEEQKEKKKKRQMQTWYNVNTLRTKYKDYKN